MSVVAYRTKTASRADMHSHLKKCDDMFMPPLSSRVDLVEYSNKLFDKSVSFEAWHRTVLIGMANAYLAGADNGAGFITNVSVLVDYRGKGVASKLLTMCLEHLRNHGVSLVRLEVSCQNHPAIKLYSSAGFRTVKRSGENLLMEYTVQLSRRPEREVGREGAPAMPAPDHNPRKASTRGTA